MTYRRIDDFVADYGDERSTTLGLFKCLNQTNLGEPLGTLKGWKSCGELAIHITNSLSHFGNVAGLDLHQPLLEAHACTLDLLCRTYDNGSLSFIDGIKKYSDERLAQPLNAFGRTMTMGQLLSLHLRHEIHHRGQLSQAMRQLNIPIVSLYGPTEEARPHTY
jgi:uncharacterized damage-inducible protein DinB